MHRVGSPSWRLGVNNSSDALSLALFVREAADLPVPDSPDTPPRRDTKANAHHTADLLNAARQEAGGQWLSWWRELVDVEIRTHEPISPDGDIPSQMRERMAYRQRFFDPPAFAALNDRPALRTAVLATFEEARSRRPEEKKRQTRDHEVFDWALTRDVADSLAAEHAVSPDRLNASVLVIEVPGLWHRIPQPGAAICSTAVARDPQAAESLLRAVFVSGLD